MTERNLDVVGLDALESPFTHVVGSIVDRSTVAKCMQGVDVVLHAATLHKPHVETHSKREFVDTNVVGTLNLLEEAVKCEVSSFVFTSTTSAFGQTLNPQPGCPAAWITEDVHGAPKNIYGATKVAGEELCELFHYSHGLPCVVLRTSRFFPEEDDVAEKRKQYSDMNLKCNEYLHRRVDISDAVDAHLLAADKAPAIGLSKYIISATSPFERDDMRELRINAHEVVKKYFPEYENQYDSRGWKMFPEIDRVYVNERARAELNWQPKFDFQHILDLLSKGEEIQSELALKVGSKGYHRTR